MSQCVPSWDLDDHLLHRRHDQHTTLPTSAAIATATSANYDVIELTWNDVGLGKPILHNLSPIATVSPSTGGSGGDGGGTLECIVDQARSGAHQPSSDAMVPCSNASERMPVRVSGTSCTSQGSATRTAAVGKRKSMPSPRLPSVGDKEVEGRDGGRGSTETENGIFGGGRRLGVDGHDSVRHDMHSRKDGLGESRKTPISGKRSREAAVHSQSERKRRDKINQKMKTLQKLLPNSSKTDKASMLDEVIEYLKLLQAQVHMMSRMSSFPAMMLPIAMHHQQLQLSMIAQMTQLSRMGMNLGLIDPSLLNPPPLPPIFHPSAFLPLPSPTAGAWDARTAEWMQQAFMACQAQQQQPMSSEAYTRLATSYQQLYQQPPGFNQKT